MVLWVIATCWTCRNNMWRWCRVVNLVVSSEAITLLLLAMHFYKNKNALQKNNLPTITYIRCDVKNSLGFNNDLMFRWWISRRDSKNSRVMLEVIVMLPFFCSLKYEDWLWCHKSFRSLLEQLSDPLLYWWMNTKSSFWHSFCSPALKKHNHCLTNFQSSNGLKKVDDSQPETQVALIEYMLYVCRNKNIFHLLFSRF